MDAAQPLTLALSSFGVIAAAVTYRRKLLFPTVETDLGPRLSVLIKRAEANAPYSRPPTRQQVIALWLRSGWSPRVARYLGIEKHSSRGPQRRLNTLLELAILIAGVTLVVGASTWIDSLPATEPVLTIDRLASWAQAACGSSCPPSILVRVLGGIGFMLLLLHEYVPNWRFRWNARACRYERRF